jgi:hypothetical protein
LGLRGLAVGKRDDGSSIYLVALVSVQDIDG